MYATSSSERAPAARSLAAVWTELPSTYFTLAPVAFSKAAAWHFFELSTKVPPKVATTSSSAAAGATDASVSRVASNVTRWMVMQDDASSTGWCRDYSRSSRPSQLAAACDPAENGEFKVGGNGAVPSPWSAPRHSSGRLVHTPRTPGARLWRWECRWHWARPAG